ncbi:MAG TPA: Uma2 family endonuclease [Gemmataceae bacterium]|jgi:Uma2 family endonuclease|nr:Uma2 family endonuclease [Gemmataceae bacterium]
MSIGTLPTLPPFLPVPSTLRIPSAPPTRRWTADEFQRMIEAGIIKENEPVALVDGSIVYKSPRSADSPTLRHWTRAEYRRMVDIGVLQESERVELLEGWIVQKMPRNTPHDTALDKTEESIRATLPTGWRVRSQRAVLIGESEPEPDCAIVSGGLDAYLANHPKPEDIGFLVEVSDSSLSTDRVIKGRLYGRASISIYWIVNLQERQIEVYAEPTGPTDPADAAGYRVRTDYREGDTVPVVIGGQQVAKIAVASLLPRA